RPSLSITLVSWLASCVGAPAGVRPPRRRLRCFRWQQRQDGVARLLAAAARLQARPTVGKAVPRVHLALVAAHPARLSAGLQRGARRRGLEGSLARENITSCQAQIGAIEVEADAANHCLHLLLAKVGVGIGGAGLGAVEARSDAFYECRFIHGWLVEVGLF